MDVRFCNSNSNFVTGVIGRIRSFCERDFSRRLDGDVSISRLGFLRAGSGERVTTVARRARRDGVSGGTTGLWGLLNTLGCSDGIVGKVSLMFGTGLFGSDLASAKKLEAPDLSREDRPDWSRKPASYPSANIWLAARILRGMRPVDRWLREREARRETGASGSGGRGPPVEDSAKV